MAKRARMSAEELGKGNLDFIFQAAYRIGTDPAFSHMLRRAELNYERARYDGLQANRPPLGYIFADPLDAGEIANMISTKPETLTEFMKAVHGDSRENTMKHFKREDLSLVEVPFQNYYGSHLIYLDITGYTLGEPPFSEIPKPLELPAGIPLERFSKIGYKSLTH